MLHRISRAIRWPSISVCLRSGPVMADACAGLSPWSSPCTPANAPFLNNEAPHFSLLHGSRSGKCIVGWRLYTVCEYLNPTLWIGSFSSDWDVCISPACRNWNSWLLMSGLKSQQSHDVYTIQSDLRPPVQWASKPPSLWEWWWGVGEYPLNICLFAR